MHIEIAQSQPFALQYTSPEVLQMSGASIDYENAVLLNLRNELRCTDLPL